MKSPIPAVSVSFSCITHNHLLFLRSLRLAGRSRCPGLHVADGTGLVGVSVVSQQDSCRPSGLAQWWSTLSSKCSSPPPAAGSWQWCSPHEEEVEKCKRFSQSVCSGQACYSPFGRNKSRGPFQDPSGNELERLGAGGPSLGAMKTVGLLHLGHLKEFLKNASKII